MTILNPPYQAEVYRVKPKDFSPAVEVAACYVHSGDDYLLLLRAKGKPQEFTWGVPAGKVEKGEKPRQAVIRETLEETGISLEEELLCEVGTLYVRYPHIDFVYHMFTQESKEKAVVNLSDEHQDYRWVSLQKMVELPFISGAKESLQHFKALATRESIPRKAFYFIRHGETKWNTQQILNSDTDANANIDTGLTDFGRQQAINVRKEIAALPLRAVCCSPLQRAKETRDLAIEGLSLDCCEFWDLAECSSDVWSKMVALENKAGYEVCDQVQAFLHQAIQGVSNAVKQEGQVLVVAHGGVHWAMCYHMMIGEHPWKIGNCQLVHFEPVKENQWKATIIA